MPSHLTRAVFRRLVAGQRVSYHGCLATPARGRGCLRTRANSGIYVQTRSLFGIFGKQQNAATQPRLDPGIARLEEHAKRMRLSARLNRPIDIKKALEQFIQYKRQSKTPIEDRHVELIQRAYAWLRTLPTVQLGPNETKQLLLQLSQPRIVTPSELSERPGASTRSRLARQLLTNLFEDAEGQDPPGPEDVFACIKILTTSGSTLEARDMIMNKKLESANSLITLGGINTAAKDDSHMRSFQLPSLDMREAFGLLSQGFASEDNQKDLVKTLDLANDQGHPLSVMAYSLRSVCDYFITKRNAVEVWRYHDLWKQARQAQAATDVQEPEKEEKETFAYYSNLLNFCIDTKDFEWGQLLIEDVLSNSHMRPQSAHHLVLLWAAGSGKGCDEIDRMIDVMESAGNFKVDQDTINMLIQMALRQNDAYRAERFFNLGLSRRLRPNAKTYLMQIEYRCSVNDVDGALKAYSLMRSETLIEHDTAVPATNKLIRAMCGTRVHDFDSIMNVVADLTDVGARFDAGTVSVLAVLHLSRAELDDAEDLLNTHAFQYSFADRKGILNALIDFCLDPKQDTELVWATYELLKKSFDDMDRVQRSKLMTEFMRRGHGLLALTVFEHMRLHSRLDTLPVVDTYIECLKGITTLGDSENLDMLHNLLKLDTSIEPDTELHNALMEACIACGQPTQAVTFWERITRSDLGPNVRSIRLLMRVCQVIPAGDEVGVGVHRRLEAAGYEMGATYYAWVLEAIGAHDKVVEAIKLMEEAWRDKGVEPTAYMLGSLLNVLHTAEDQSQVISWAEQKVPDVYSELKKYSTGTDQLGLEQFRGIPFRGIEEEQGRA